MENGKIEKGRLEAAGRKARFLLSFTPRSLWLCFAVVIIKPSVAALSLVSHWVFSSSLSDPSLISLRTSSFSKKKKHPLLCTTFREVEDVVFSWTFPDFEDSQKQLLLSVVSFSSVRYSSSSYTQYSLFASLGIWSAGKCYLVFCSSRFCFWILRKVAALYEFLARALGV